LRRDDNGIGLAWPGDRRRGLAFGLSGVAGVATFAGVYHAWRPGWRGCQHITVTWADCGVAGARWAAAACMALATAAVST